MERASQLLERQDVTQRRSAANGPCKFVIASRTPMAVPCHPEQRRRCASLLAILLLNYAVPLLWKGGRAAGDKSAVGAFVLGLSPTSALQLGTLAGMVSRERSEVRGSHEEGEAEAASTLLRVNEAQALRLKEVLQQWSALASPPVVPYFVLRQRWILATSSKS